MARLDKACTLRFLCHFDVGGFSHELLDVHGIHAVVGALIVTFSTSF